ncbi:MAG: ABC transporter substrate-binding protein [Micrococcaceae bacterium]|nr:ABC transporter substrate-binding protein [Micrococcaceae bacterium]
MLTGGKLRITPSRHRTPKLLLAATLSATMLVACSSLPGAVISGPGVSLGSAKFIDDPKAYEGPSTAQLSQPILNPVANNPDTKLPVTVQDAQDTTVTISDVSRILPIDLYGTSSRIVFDLGLGENVIGRDASSDFDEIKDLPLVTQNGHELNAEAILQLAPTVIITDSSLGPWDVVLQMREAGIPVLVLDSHRSLENTEDMIMQISSALGVPDEGERLAKRTQKEVDEMVAKISAIAPRGDERLRMLFLYARGQSGVYYLFGKESGADSLIQSLGGIDVASEIGWKGMSPMTDEAMVEAEPDLVIMMTKGLESTGGAEAISTSVPALAHTPAGAKKRIVDMADSQVLSFGPNSAGILEALSVAIYAPETAVATK